MRELFDEPNANEDLSAFEAEHGIELYKALIMRNSGLGSIDAIRQDIRRGFYDKSRLQEIEKDEDMQYLFSEVMKVQNKYPDSSEVQDIVGNFPRDILAGWLLFTINYHEKLWNLTLLTDEERKI